MAKADADNRHLRGIGVADEPLQRRDEGVILIGAVAAAGNQPAVAVAHARGKLHRFDVEAAEGQTPPGQEALEKIGIVAVFGAQGVGRGAGL